MSCKQMVMSKQNKQVLINNLQYCKFPNGFNSKSLVEAIANIDNEFNEFGLSFFNSCISSSNERLLWKILLERLYRIHHEIGYCAISRYINTFLVLLNPYIISVNEITTERMQEQLINEAYKIING